MTGGYPGVDAELLRSLAAAGADAIEVGVPHSDPIMDGGVIQQASAAAIAAGVHPSDVLQTIADADVDVPVAVMTYANIVLASWLGTVLRGSQRGGRERADRAGHAS